MLQIKTIWNLDPDGFDRAVNAALTDGWELRGRKLVQTPTSKHDYLYAELEKTTITEEEKCCENCKHNDKTLNAMPCRCCTTDADKWEPMA